MMKRERGGEGSLKTVVNMKIYMKERKYDI
jgi:hypothetical protein